MRMGLGGWGRLEKAPEKAAKAGKAPDELIIKLSDGYMVREPRTQNAVYAVSLCINILAMIMPLVIMQVYDRVLPGNARDTLWMMTIAMAGVIALDVLLKQLRSHVVGWWAADFSHQANVEAVRRIAAAPYGLIEKEPMASHVNRLNAIGAVGDYHGGVSKLTIIDLPFISIFLVLMAFVGGWLALVPVGVFLIFAAAATNRTRQMRQVVEERANQDNKKYDFIIEVLSGIQTVKALAMEPQIQRRLERLQRSVTSVTHRVISLSSQTQSAAVLYGNLSQIVVVAFGAVMVINHSLSIGSLVCCTLLSGQILQPLSRIISIISERQTISYKRSEAAHLFDLPTVKLSQPAPQGRGYVSIENLTYSRATDDRPVFDRANLTIAPGMILGLKGVNGSGRSILVRLIRGDIKPQSGRILVDGVEPSIDEQGELRGSIVIVGTHPVVFQGTILDNLTMFEIGKYKQAALEASRLIGLEAAVHRLPNGYDTPVGDGAQLSLAGSFAQQLAIARAIARNPRILVLDEANTVLDPKAEADLIKALHALKGRMTIIITTHRPSLLNVADKVALLEDHQIMEIARGELRQSEPPPKPAEAAGLAHVASPPLSPPLPANPVDRQAMPAAATNPADMSKT